MAGGTTDLSEREERFGEIVFAYLRARDEGRRPDPREWLARYPEFGPELAGFFADQEEVDRLGAPLRQVAQSVEPLGDFEIVREVGRGGMGIVYEAVQRSLGRRVALKVLPLAATMDPRQLQRFRNEARAAASLHHEHIVPVYAVGQERGVHYYTMQFIDGQSLAQRIAAERGDGGAATAVTRVAVASTVPPAPGAARWRLVAEWGIQAAEALEHAHSVGVVHRDVKPANLMIDGRGKLWVTDFGLARLGADAGLTMTGDVVGTLRYMSPEQALGKHGLVDHHTDVYALGVTLYELLTLRPAVGGDDREEILRGIASAEPRPPRGLDRTIPIDLDTILLKAMAKEPAERYATARDMADDLRRFLESRPILARRPTAAVWVARWSRRHKGAARAGVAFLVLAALALALSTALIANERAEALRQKGDADAQREEAVRRKGEADEQRRVAVERSRELRRQVYAAEIGRAYHLSRAAQLPTLPDLLSPWRPAGDEDDLRGFEWYYLNWLGRGGPGSRWTLRGHVGEVYAVAYAPDGKTLASSGNDPIIRLWDPVTGRLRASLVGHWGKVGGIAFSPDGQLLASASDDGTVKLWDVPSRQARATLRGHTDRVYCVAFSADGTLVASGGKDRSVRLWAVDGRALGTREAHAAPVESVAFSPDGTALATGGDDTELKLWSLRRAVRVEIGPEPGARFGGYFNGAQCVRFSHDGRLLAGSSGGGAIRIYEANTGRPVASWPGALDTNRIDALAFSPDDKILASADGAARVCLWDLPHGTLRRVLRGHSDRAKAVAFAPDGRTVASGGYEGTVRVWNLSQRPEYGSLPDPQEPVTFLAFAEGHTLTTGTEGGRVAWWDVAGEPGLRKEVRSTRPGRVAAVAPGGRTVALAGPEKTLRLWDPDTGGERPLPFPCPWDDPWRAAFSPDGRWLATSNGYDVLCLVELATGRYQGLRHCPSGWRALDFQGDCRTLLAGPYDDNCLSVFDVTAGKEVGRIDPNSCPYRAAYSPSGACLAVAAQDASVRLIEATTGKPRFTLLGHTQPAGAMTFAADGKTLVTAGADGQVKLWQVATGRELLTLQDNPGEDVRCAAFSADGTVLAVGGRTREGKGFVRLCYGPDGRGGN